MVVPHLHILFVHIHIRLLYFELIVHFLLGLTLTYLGTGVNGTRVAVANLVNTLFGLTLVFTQSIKVGHPVIGCSILKMVCFPIPKIDD